MSSHLPLVEAQEIYSFVASTRDTDASENGVLGACDFSLDCSVEYLRIGARNGIGYMLDGRLPGHGQYRLIRGGLQ